MLLVIIFLVPILSGNISFEIIWNNYGKTKNEKNETNSFLSFILMYDVTLSISFTFPRDQQLPRVAKFKENVFEICMIAFAVSGNSYSLIK